jgi:hypothetical protein
MFVQHAATEVPTGLPDDLVGALGKLSGAPRGIAEAAIAALPHSLRAALVSWGPIEPISSRADHPSDIVITDAGHRVIAACAERMGPDADTGGARARLERERARYRAALLSS